MILRASIDEEKYEKVLHSLDDGIRLSASKRTPAIITCDSVVKDESVSHRGVLAESVAFSSSVSLPSGAMAAAEKKSRGDKASIQGAEKDLVSQTRAFVVDLITQ